MAFTRAFALTAGLFSALDSAGDAIAGELEGLSVGPVAGELEGTRGTLDAAPPGSPDAGFDALPDGEFLSALRRTTSRSKSFTYTTLELPGSAFVPCVARRVTEVSAALPLRTGMAMEANKRNSGIRRKNFIGLPRSANGSADWVSPTSMMIEDCKKERSITLKYDSTPGAPIPIDLYPRAARQPL